MITQIEDLNESWVKILGLYLLLFSEKWTVKERYGRVKSGRAGSAQIFVLNDSDGPNMKIKMFNSFFLIFLKVLELFECHPGDLYLTANRNFVCFAHS